MNTADTDRVLADLEALAAADERLVAPPHVAAGVMAQWDARVPGASPFVLRWWSYTGLAAVSAAVVVLATVLDMPRVSNELVLPDGSRVETRAGSELSVERAADGIGIRLARGSIIVHAAKQRSGHLYVRTRDMTASVVGTVFVVNAEAEGSRVAVIEGEVRVQLGTTAQNLRSGQQVLTGTMLEPNPVRDDIAWSRNAASLARLLQTASQNAPAPPPIDVAAIEIEEKPAQDDAVDVFVARRSTDTPRPGTVDPARERQLEDALASGVAATGLSLSVTTGYRQLNRAEYSVPVTVRIAPSRELTVGRGERSLIDIVGVVTDSFGTVQVNLRDEATLTVAADRIGALATTPIVYETAFTMLPGMYTLRLAVLDQTTGRMGAADVKFVVPNLNRRPAN